MELLALGTGGWIPTQKRQTACYLVDTGKSLIILDTGTGLSRLSKYSNLVNKYDELHIIYSHYHLDHLMGLVFLSNWAKEKKIYFYGPGESLGFNSCRDVLSGILTPPYFINIDSIYNRLDIKDYDLNGFNINDTVISITKQVHRGGSFGITLDDKLHYATDTIECEETFRKAEGVNLLLHDCWLVEPDENNEHSSFNGIIKMLANYNVKQAGLVHINPNWDDETFELLRGRTKHHNIFLAEDNMKFEL